MASHLALFTKGTSAHTDTIDAALAIRGTYMKTFSCRFLR